MLRKSVIAFFVAPLLPAFVQAFLLNKPYEFNTALLVAELYTVGLYLLQLVVGVPAFLVFRRLKRHPVWAYMLVGFFTLYLFVLVLWQPTCGDESCRILDGIWQSVPVSLWGAATAGIFWFVARPDRVAAPSDLRWLKITFMVLGVLLVLSFVADFVFWYRAQSDQARTLDPEARAFVDL